MTQEEITNNNKLIAEFMGMGNNPKFYNLMSPTLLYVIDRAKTSCTAEELRFDFSWDWLMPVCHKIARINHETIDTNVLRMPSWEFGSIGLESSITSVWEAVVKFINWYNENKEE